MSWKLGNFGFFGSDIIGEQSLSIKDLGLESRQKENYIYDNSIRDYHGYLFQYTLDGYGIYENRNTRYKLTKGKAFLISFPEESKYYLSQAEDDPEYSWTFFYIHFSGPAVAPFFNRIRELTGSVLELEIDSLPISYFFELYNNLQSQRPVGHYMGSEWLYRFLIALLRNVEFPPTGKSSPHVAAAIEWINRNYSKQINLEEMCPEIGVTYSHLTRQFCKEQGISPVQYLTKIRLEHGMQLLLNTNLSIQKIAEECGFSCANYFTKVYKKAIHITPVEYRNQHKLTGI
ncbi:AraC family transcriptional regulator [Clostridium sp. BNL1100]|uniref:AraC family transcriptional regulator n=1 Tax=Clostridium sp. BNL1100 TaxID=755731 RepID=UPI00024A7C4E|nr:AraC family transcriptional regulator [Clostridium sp. BNL1100]AEY64482.1 DNA-binding domain-containing protein, AraC-type [Clostridium sp. BNL1100]